MKRKKRMAQALLNQHQATGLSGAEFEVVIQLQQIFPDYALAVLSDLVNSVIMEVGRLDIQDLVPICVQKIINQQTEAASTHTERRNNSVELNPMQKQVLPHLHNIFPNIPKAVIETSVRHHSNLWAPLDEGLLLQRCIDDLLDRRTAGEATKLPEESRGDGRGASDADVLFTGRDSPKDVLVTGIQHLHDKVDIHASDDEVLIFNGGDTGHNAVNLKGTKNNGVAKQTSISSAGCDTSTTTVTMLDRKCPARATGDTCPATVTSLDTCITQKKKPPSLCKSQSADNFTTTSCTATTSSLSKLMSYDSMKHITGCKSSLSIGGNSKSSKCHTETNAASTNSNSNDRSSAVSSWLGNDEHVHAGTSDKDAASSKESNSASTVVDADKNRSFPWRSNDSDSSLFDDSSNDKSDIDKSPESTVSDLDGLPEIKFNQRIRHADTKDSRHSLFRSKSPNRAIFSTKSSVTGCDSVDKPAVVVSTRNFAVSQCKKSNNDDEAVIVDAYRANPGWPSDSDSTLSIDDDDDDDDDMFDRFSSESRSSSETDLVTGTMDRAVDGNTTAIQAPNAYGDNRAFVINADSDENTGGAFDDSVQIIEETVLTDRSVLSRSVPAPPSAVINLTEETVLLPPPNLGPRPPDPAPVIRVQNPAPLIRPQNPAPVIRVQNPAPVIRVQNPAPVIRPQNPAPVIRVAQQKPKMDIKTEVLSLFPDVDPGHLDQLCLHHLGETALNNICFVLLETKYPRKVTEPATAVAESVTKTPKPASVDYFKDYQSVIIPMHVSSKYICQSVDLLCTEFSWMSVKNIRQLFHKFEHYAPTYKCLDCIWEQAKMLVADSGKSGGLIVRFSGLKFTADIELPNGSGKLAIQLLKGRRPTSSLRSGVLEELQREVTFVQRKLKEKVMHADLEVAQQLNEQEYEDQGQCIECGCCYGEYPFDNMVQCYDGHLFCESCLRQYAQESVFGHGKFSHGHLFCESCLKQYAQEFVFGHGKANLMCMTDACESLFPKNQLEKALSSEILARYEDRVTEENLNLADVGGDLVRCPHCEFAAFMDPDDKVFRCQSANCGKQTCRYCKEDWDEHFGKKCEEIEKKDETKLRVQYEEKMTQAKVRVCHKCKAQFMKETGCNKMICRCGAKMCYICRKPNIDYNHFCQHPREPGKTCDKCKACSLWTNADEDDDRAVAEIQKEAGEIRKNQGFTDDKLIGAPTMPPSKKPRIAGHNQNHH